MTSELSDTDIVVRTKAVLDENFIKEPPIDVYEIARNYGLQIEETEFPEQYSQISGFIMVSGKTPHLVVNTKDSPNRKKFTVAHELAHWLLHRNKLIEDPTIGVLLRIPLGKLNTDPTEKEANIFAANLLVPKEMLAKHKKGKSNKELAELFQVSEEVIGYRQNHVAQPKTKKKK